MHWLDSSRFIESDFFFIHETLKVSVPNRLWGAGWESSTYGGFLTGTKGAVCWVPIGKSDTYGGFPTGTNPCLCSSESFCFFLINMTLLTFGIMFNHSSYFIKVV